MLISAEPFSGSYNLDQGEEVCNLNSYYSVRYNMCKGLAYSLDWNKYMKITNGNKEPTITIGHWNGGSSQLGKSAKGIEKLEQIKHILGNNKIDILGISEANLKQDLDPCHYRIEGFDCIKSGGNTARTITYIKAN